jgi:hypothetical protein
MPEGFTGGQAQDDVRTRQVLLLVMDDNAVGTSHIKLSSTEVSSSRAAAPFVSVSVYVSCVCV